MRRTIQMALVAALALSVVAAEGEDLTDHPCYDAETDQVVYTEEQVWFHEGDAKLGNASETAAPWDTTPPSSSVTGGAGAGTISFGNSLRDVNGDLPTPQASFAGSFEGCIGTLLFDVYSFDPTNRAGTGATAEPGDHNFSLTVTVDGTKVYDAGRLQGSTEFANEGFGPNRTRFSLDVEALMTPYLRFTDLTLDGQHEITISIGSWFANTGNGGYVWDTTEVPAGLTFNGAAADEYPAVSVVP